MVTQVNNFVFCPPDPGKPDPHVRRGSKPRKRIPQSEQKGGTCAYYAMKIIRNQIGKNYSPEFEEQRRIEKLISDKRKLHTKIWKDYDWIMSFAKDFTECFGPFTKKKYEDIFNRNKLTDEGRKHITIFKQFYSQNKYPDLLTFVNDAFYKKEIAIEEEFLQNTNSLIPSEEKKQSLKAKCKYLAALSFERCVSLYNLNRSSWNPNLPISSLIKQLRVHGPHLVCGQIGEGYYEEEPKEIKRIAGRSIFGWSPNAKRSEEELGHVVIIVGAKKDPEEVYFIDPADYSDPNDITTQKIYVIDYRELKASISDLHGSQFVNFKSNEIIHLDNNNYSLYGDPNTNYL